MNGVLSYFSHIIFPTRCPACGRLAVPFCAECLSEAAAAPLPPFCSECGGPYGAECCYGSLPCYAAALHEGAARRFILALKYKNIRSLGEAIGKEMALRFPEVGADFLVPLPLHRGSARAYNQTELISRGISHLRGIAVAKNFLKWRVACGAQTLRNGEERSALSFASFEASKELSGRRVILVDDVYTTGGTVRAASFALRLAGADVRAIFLWTRRVPCGENPAAWPVADDEDDFLV